MSDPASYPGLRRPLLELLRCPLCRERGASGELEVAEATERVPCADEPDGALRRGRLTCTDCGASYPVERGIPRMLPDKLSPVQDATRHSFGYQWQAYSRDLEEWSRRCRELFEPFDPPELGRHAVLDAGCGYGRWLAEMAPGGGLCVGMDLSDAVFAAADHLGAHPNCHLVQGDLLRPPFAPSTFRTVYSIGVLHHLPDGAPPGVDALVPLVRPGGLFFAWLYGVHRGDSQANLYTVLRRLTRALPKPLMGVACWLAAVVIQGAFLVPKRLLSRLSVTRGLADRLPFHSYRDLPFSELRTDLFDMYATPIEYGYDEDGVRQMLEAAGLEEIGVTACGIPRRPDASWRGWGSQPASAPSTTTTDDVEA